MVMGQKDILLLQNFQTVKNFQLRISNLKYILGTDLQESDVVFGGMKKLKQSIIEATKNFQKPTLFTHIPHVQVD